MPPAALAPWRTAIAHALHRHRARPESRYLQLATCDRQGRPTNRTVVFRGWQDPGDGLWLVTDARSAKLPGLVANPWVELCWYFPQTREQFRLRGRAIALMADHTQPAPNDSDPPWFAALFPTSTLATQARHTAWQTLSAAARQQFAWPTPGQPRSPNLDFTAPSPHPDHPLPQFVVLWVLCDRVDWLQLRDSPHTRQLYQRQADGTWAEQAIVP
jgi:PPOX class probable FMN-dependent enzyme